MTSLFDFSQEKLLACLTYSPAWWDEFRVSDEEAQEHSVVERR